MPRPLRIEFPDACYHVICRGNARLPIFREDRDKELLLDRMVHFAELFRLEVRAYCVMVNHVHIHLRTREANLGGYMRSFLTSFTSMYNHRHNSCGHVFQGRYKAYLIEDAKAYIGKVTQYIHLNPLRIRSLEDAPLDVRHQAALDFQWSRSSRLSAKPTAVRKASFCAGTTGTVKPGRHYFTWLRSTAGDAIP